MRLRWRDLGPDRLGETWHQVSTIVLAPDLTQAERRSTLTHELVHLERGPVPPALRAREERAVDAEAACRLITLEQLADALVWSFDDHELAEELWVDVATVRARLAALGEEETALLNKRLDVAELELP